MKVGIIGLGRMGLGMSRRMMRDGIEVWGYRRNYEKAQEAYENGYVDDKAILKIISMCNIKVITNSNSFYWIAAYISKKSNSKIYISENYSIKNNLVHPNWIKF